VAGTRCDAVQTYAPSPNLSSAPTRNAGNPGFDWPLDGRHYGPNENPHVPASVVRPPGFNLDPTRTEPPGDAPDTDGLIGGMFVLDPSQKHPGIEDPRN